MSRTTTNLEMGRPKTCCTKVKLCIRLGEKFRQSYFGAVMTSSKSRKTAKNQKIRDFSEFSQLWACLSQVWVKISCFPTILSIFSIWNNCKTSFKSLALKMWSGWPQENQCQKSVKLCKFSLFWLSIAAKWLIWVENDKLILINQF